MMCPPSSGVLVSWGAGGAHAATLPAPAPNRFRPGWTRCRTPFERRTRRPAAHVRRPWLHPGPRPGPARRLPRSGRVAVHREPSAARPGGPAATGPGPGRPPTWGRPSRASSSRNRASSPRRKAGAGPGARRHRGRRWRRAAAATSARTPVCGRRRDRRWSGPRARRGRGGSHRGPGLGSPEPQQGLGRAGFASPRGRRARSPAAGARSTVSAWSSAVCARSSPRARGRSTGRPRARASRLPPGATVTRTGRKPGPRGARPALPRARRPRPESGRIPWSTCTAVTRQPGRPPPGPSERGWSRPPPDTPATTSAPAARERAGGASRSLTNGSASERSVTPGTGPGRADAVPRSVPRASAGGDGPGDPGRAPIRSSQVDGRCGSRPWSAGSPGLPTPGPTSSGPPTASTSAMERLAQLVLAELGLEADQLADQASPGTGARRPAGPAAPGRNRAADGMRSAPARIHGDVAVALEQGHQPADLARGVFALGTPWPTGRRGRPSSRGVVAGPGLGHGPGAGASSRRPGSGVGPTSTRPRSATGSSR